jgi:hypothetical protein
MSSTFNNLGFDTLYIKGQLFDIATFRGAPGDDQTSSSKGLPGDNGIDKGFEFNTINTTASSTVITLPDANLVSYSGIIVKCNGKLTSTTTMVGELKSILVQAHDTVVKATLYNNNIPQTVRLTKVTYKNATIDGVLRDSYSFWSV